MEQMFRRTAQQVLDQFGVTRQGLTTEQVEKQRATYGENALTEGQKKGPLVVHLCPICLTRNMMSLRKQWTRSFLL